MKADQVLDEIEVLAQRQFLPIVGPEKGKVLARIAKKQKPKTILEIGTLIGYSAILIAKNVPYDSKIVCVEINPRLAEIARQNFSRAGFDNINVVVGDAKKIIPKLQEKFDFVFIDALKEDYLAYLHAVEDKLNEKAVIVADNAGVFAEAMEDYLEYVRNSGKYRSKTYLAYGDALEVSVKV